MRASHLYLIFFWVASCQSTPTIGSVQAKEPAKSAPTSATAPAKETSAPATSQSLPTVPIIDSFVPFDDERKRLTLEYIRAHYDPKATDITIDPKVIVIHWTGTGGSAKNIIDGFSRTYVNKGRTEVRKGGELNVSSQFVIDRDGTIYRLMEETTMARHCIGLNRVAIGVENVGDGDKHPLTDAQLSANIALVRYLKAKFSQIEYLIGHFEYRQLEGTPLFVELDPKYRSAKPDPGPEFMKKLRAGVGDLGLQGPLAGKK